MADSRLHDGEPEELLLPFPVVFTFPGRIPKAEVEAFILAYPELRLNLMPFEEARERVAKYYFLKNENRLKNATPIEREKYYAAQEVMQKAIDKEKNGENAGRVNYRKRKDELTGAMQGSLTKAGGEIVEQNAKGLIEVNRLIAIEDKELRLEELREFLRRSAKEFNQENKE